MFELLLPFLILATDSQVPTSPMSTEAATIAEWTFEADSDKDYDGRPDGWTRWRGPGFPNYVEIGLASEPAATGSQAASCLRIELDGGAGRFISPAIAVQPQFSFVLRGRIYTRDLKHSRAFLTLAFCDAQGKVLETHQSDMPSTNGAWTDIGIGPVACANPDMRQAVLGLHLEPTEESDLRGGAYFDDIRLGRLPRMTLQANRENNLFFRPADVAVTCRVSGFSNPSLPVHFELLDLEGNVLAEDEQITETEEQSRDAEQPPGPADPVATLATDMLSGVARWQPPVPGGGFYQVRASIAGHAGSLLVNLVVLDQLPRSNAGEFGWTLPRGDAVVPLRTLNHLLPEAGIHWVKLPMWYEDSDKLRGEDLARFAERLSAQHVQVVGVLDSPPPSLRKLFAEMDPLPVASVFVDPAVWQPALDPVLTRLSLVVRWWQLGSDADTSFVGLPQLDAKFAQMRADLGRFGHDLNLGLSWRILDEVPVTSKRAWSFLCYTADPALTADELRACLAPLRATAGQSWMLLQPLPRSEYGLQVQSQDLVLRMIAAKQAGASGIFLPDPFDAEHGLLQADGSPGPLFIPWRTAATLLGGSEYVGSLQLAGGSHNHVFARGSEAVVVIWGDKPQQERLQLGGDVRQFDIWGKSREVGVTTVDGLPCHEVEVGTTPTFLVGVDAGLMRWMMAVRFESAELDSVFGRPQTIVCQFTNTFPRGVGGTVTLHTPELWEVESRRSSFKLGVGEQRQQPFRISLGANASSGSQPVWLEFNFAAERDYRFRVSREVRVGLDGLNVNITTRLDERGNLLVEQQLANESDRLVSFNCLLFVPDRRRERHQVYKLGQGQITNTFVLPRGEELLGRTLWLRAEEIDGPRIFNYHVVAHE